MIKALSLRQKFYQLLCSQSTMAYLILHVVAQFGKGLIVTLGHKNRVVPKSARSPLFIDNDPFDYALKKVLFAIDQQGDYGAKTGLSIFNPLQL